jgi:hypothetical protein
VGFRITIIGNSINSICADLGWYFLVVVNFITANGIGLGEVAEPEAK